MSVTESEEKQESNPNANMNTPRSLQAARLRAKEEKLERMKERLEKKGEESRGSEEAQA